MITAPGEGQGAPGEGQEDSGNKHLLKINKSS